MHLVYSLPNDIQFIIFKKKHELEMKLVMKDLKRNYKNSLYGCRVFSCSLYHFIACTRECICRDSKAYNNKSFKFNRRLANIEKKEIFMYNKRLEPYDSELDSDNDNSDNEHWVRDDSD